MIDTLLVVLYTAVVIIALLLIGLILIQPSKSGGFGGTFGGVGESVFGAYAGSHLSRLTVILISLFFILTLMLAVITSHRAKDKSVAEVNIIKSDLAAKSQATIPQPKKDQSSGDIPEKAVNKVKVAGKIVSENKAGTVKE